MDKTSDELSDDLQIEGIIPRSRSPVPLEDRDPDDLSREEARELVRRMRARYHEAGSVKKEKGNGLVAVKNEKRHRSATMLSNNESNKDQVDFISENPAKKRQRSAFHAEIEIEVIDLSED